MKKKLLSLLLVAVMAVSMLAACGGNNGGGSDEAKKTIVYWSMWEEAEPQGQAIKEAVEAFEKETGYDVDLQFKGRTGIREGLQPALDNGTVIDVFDEDIDRVNTAWGKYLMDLETFVKDSNYEATANAGLMAACRAVAGGTLKSIPYQANVFGVFYNKTLFDKAGITAVPTTWDEFIAVCDKLVAAGITPMTMDDAYATCLIGYHLGRYVGEEAVVKIVKEGLWDDPAVVQMAKDIEYMAQKGYFSKNVGTNVWPNGQNVELAGGEVAMYLNGSWLPNEVKNLVAQDLVWGCFAYPALNAVQSNIEGAQATGTDANNFGSQVYAINKDSKVGAEAFKLIEYITKGTYDAKLAELSIGIPADSTNTEWPELVSCVKPVIDNSKVRFSWAVGVESNADMTPVIKENFIKLMAGTLSADDFIKAMEDASK